MVILHLLLLIIFLLILVKSAGFAIKYSSNLARIFRISEFIISFFIVSIISISPETTISIISALKGVPELGVSTLLGSNVADLTLVFGIVSLFSLKGIKVKSNVLKESMFYVVILAFPVIFGLNGYYSRIEGICLIALGILFFLTLSFENKRKAVINKTKNTSAWKNLLLLVVSLIILIISAYYTVRFGQLFAVDLGIPSFLIGLTVISLGTCLPELLFSIKAVEKDHDGLALGDLLGTVLTDATIILGIVAVINPFSFNPVICYTAGIFMLVSSFVLMYFMKTGKILSKKEGVILILVYVLFLLISLFIK